MLGQTNIQLVLSTLEFFEMLRRFFALMAVVLVPGMVENAGAAIQNGSLITINRVNHNLGVPDNSYDTSGTWGTGSGGEFRVSENVALGEVFKTFCIERNEFINLPGTYYVTLETAARAGGVGGGSPDPIGDATKWLYYWYTQNVLDTQVPGFQYDDAGDADHLQNAFWQLEQEGVTASGLGASLVAAATGAGSWNSNLGDVFALNLWGSYNQTTGAVSGYKQSQLYFRSRQGGNEIPEPASMAIWGLMALGGVVAFRRRAA